MIKILLPVFNITTGWYFGDVEVYKKVCAKREDNDGIYKSNIDQCSGFCSGSIAWVEDYTEVGAILHELTHMVHHILEAVGVDDEETRAYCTGYLGERLFKAMDKKFGGENNGTSKD